MNSIEHIRHSLAHLMAAAITQLYPDAQLTLGPAIEDGFYYDVNFPTNKPSTDEDLAALESKMREILPTWHGFERMEVTADEARKVFAGNPFKLELIDGIVEKGEEITLYKSGDFVDLCRGGHVEDMAKDVSGDCFKIDKTAGAYWRGKSENPMLTRIYGLAFVNKEELDAELARRIEAEKRDHRKIGQEQELFFTDEIVGKGLIMWQPRGTLIRDEIEKLAREKEEEYGYVRVVTPHLAKQELFLRSGHLPYYEEDMYPKMEMDDGTYYLKAMNCPHHHIMYGHTMHSYRDMPMRIAEYGTVYRNELSGTLAGLLRVRCLAMNDAHIYCRKDQIATEFRAALQMTMDYFKLFGLSDYWFRLSRWDSARTDKYIDEPENWEYTENVIREILVEVGVPFIEATDEAAFYGPKVDVQFKSVIGRTETMSTVQLDFAAKKRFELTYIDSEGKENNEVFVIHRAPLSTHERFMAFLIEHFAGVWPVWLSPVHVAVLPISGDKHGEYAESIQKELRKAGIRVDLLRDGTLGNRIRNAKNMKVPYQIVVGDAERDANTVTVEGRNDLKLAGIPLSEFIERISGEIKERVLN